jgi:heme exporter protein A
VAYQSVTVEAAGVTKRFGKRGLFNPLSFTVEPGEIVAITGSNGSGKSTLLKILAQVLSPTKGECRWLIAGQKIEASDLRAHTGFVAPYLEVYGDLTATEHVRMVSEWKGRPVSDLVITELLALTELDTRAVEGNRHLRAFSSGMKQRVRFAMAFAGDPSVLLMDEPTSNLDKRGTTLMLDELTRRAREGATVLIATNEEREIEIAHRSVAVVPL